MHQDDRNRSPASDDDWTQQFLEQRWLLSMRSLESAMLALRDLWPEMVSALPETGADHIKRALDQASSSLQSLHEAGPFVIGSSAYNDYLNHKVNDRVETATERITDGSDSGDNAGQ